METITFISLFVHLSECKILKWTKFMLKVFWVTKITSLVVCTSLRLSCFLNRYMSWTVGPMLLIFHSKLHFHDLEMENWPILAKSQISPCFWYSVYLSVRTSFRKFLFKSLYLMNNWFDISNVLQRNTFSWKIQIWLRLPPFSAN